MWTAVPERHGDGTEAAGHAQGSGLPRTRARRAQVATTPQTLQDRARVSGAGRPDGRMCAGRCESPDTQAPRSVDPDRPVFPSLPQRELPP